ncbi:hypothetical protein VE03_10502 [Pseudogymnoascus sp. 23342-1-I1]|nr:hypothetical protein VE03_10502 [Pseudogymnoascus sp. 23342-1-I1]
MDDTALLVSILRQVQDRDSIKFLEKDDPSLADRAKLYAEEVTVCPWDWWPLGDPKLPLAADQIRITWPCHENGCKFPCEVDVTVETAERIKANLEIHGFSVAADKSAHWRYHRASRSYTGRK